MHTIHNYYFCHRTICDFINWALGKMIYVSITSKARMTHFWGKLVYWSTRMMERILTALQIPSLNVSRCQAESVESIQNFSYYWVQPLMGEYFVSGEGLLVQIQILEQIRNVPFWRCIGLISQIWQAGRPHPRLTVSEPQHAFLETS